MNMNEFLGSGTPALASTSTLDAKGEIATAERQPALERGLLADRSRTTNTPAIRRKEQQSQDTLAIAGRYVSQREAAKFLGISRSTLFRLRRDDPTFPKAVYFSCGVMRFCLSDLIVWAAGKSIADIQH